MPNVHLYTAEEIPEAPMCLSCQPVKITRQPRNPYEVSPHVSFWYEPCEDHQPKGEQ